MLVKELKLALINKDIEKLKELSTKTPNVSSLEEARELKALIKEVNSFLTQERNRILKEMQKMKKLQKFQKEVKSFDFKG